MNMYCMYAYAKVRNVKRVCLDGWLVGWLDRSIEKYKI